MNPTNKKYPKLDIVDPKAAVNDLRKLQQVMVNALVELGLEYSNKITGKFLHSDSDDYFELREAIYYRLDGLLLHLDLLIALQSNHQKSFSKDPFNARSNHNLLDFGAQHQLLIYDSIVFHAISLFDYVGNLIDYICGTKKQKRLKWNGVLDSVRDSNNKLSKSPITPIVLSVHKTFVDRLYRYRSDIIHYRNDNVAATTNIKLNTAETDFVVFAPDRLTSLFPELTQLSESNRLTLRYVSFWLCNKSINSSLATIQPIFEHIEINRKTPKGFAIFLKDIPRKSKR